MSGIPSSWTGTPTLGISGTGALVLSTCLSVVLTSQPQWDICHQSSDETWNSGTRVFTFQLQAHGDSVSESGETVTATLTDPDNSSRTVSFTITIDEPASQPTITITGGSAVTEGGNATFTLNLNPAPTANLQVDFTVSEETGDGQEFVLSGRTGSHNVTVAANSATSSFTVPTVNDSTDEPNGSVTATLAARTGYTIGTPSSASVTVNDDDTPTLSIGIDGNTSVVEGDSGIGTVDFPVTLSGPTVVGRVDFQVCFSGTATVDTDTNNDFPSGEDYQVFLGGTNQHGNCADGRINLGATTSQAIVSIKWNTDTAVEPDETVIATLTLRGTSNPPDVSLGTATATFTILNDDTAAAPRSRSDFAFLASYDNTLERSEGAAGRAHFAVMRVRVPPVNAPPTFEMIPDPWGFRVCFEGTATLGADYRVFNRSNEPLTLDGDGCSALNDRGEGTGLAAGQDRAHFYLQVIDDAHEDSGETVEVYLNGAAGTSLFKFARDPQDNPQYDEDAVAAVKEKCARGGPCPTDRLIFTILNHDGPPPAAGPYADLVAKMYGWRNDPKWKSYKAHTDRWDRALLAFGENVEDASLQPMSAAQAQVFADRGWQRWVPVAKALHEIEAARLSPPGAALRAVLSAPSGDVAEAGGRKTLTIALGRTLEQGEALTVPLAFGGTATLGDDYVLAAPGTIPQGVSYANLASTDPTTPPAVTFTGPSAQSATLVLTATADGIDEGTGETVTVATGTLAATGLDDGAEGEGTAAFAIVEPPIAVSVSAAVSSLTEGAEAAFTVTASRAPASDLAVTLTVSDAKGSDFLAAASEGAHSVTIAKGTTEASFAVATVNDSAHEPDGPIAVTVAKGAGYAVAASPDDTASVEVVDDDAAPAVPELTVGDATANEADRFMWFTVKLGMASNRPVRVSYRTRESTPVSARKNEDFLQYDFGSLTFRPGETSKRFWGYLFNDNHDEDAETFEVVLSDPTGGARIADGVGVGTIVNSDPMPAAWLARFGRTVAEQALDGIAGRIAAPRAAGVQGAIAGQALNFDPGSQSGAGNAAIAGVEGAGPLALSGLDASAGRVGRAGFGAGFGHDAHGLAQSRTMTGLEALLGSSFTATGEHDATGGSLAFWGRAAQSSFDGREGTFSLDGETTTAMLGADYARGKWLVGLALMQSSGEGGYADAGTGSVRCPQDLDAETRAVLCDGAVRQGDGDVEASLTAAVPYAAIQASERLRLWGAAGFGTGDVTLKPAMGGSLKSDISWTMAAAGGRSDLLQPPKEGSGPTLALTADALWARTSSEKTHELAASDSDVTRLRLGLEGGYAIAMEGGGSLMPKVEIGARHDGGDAETGFGVELGGGIAWTDPAIGLSLDLSGRTLISHSSDDLEDQGFAASLAFDPNPGTERGLSLTLRQDWGGSAEGGLDALFATDPLADRAGTVEATSRWQAEAAYGFPAFSGRFTGSPHVGLGLATGARDYTLGWRLSPAANANAPDVSFGVKATRRENDTAAPEHAVGFEINARW